MSVRIFVLLFAALLASCNVKPPEEDKYLQQRYWIDQGLNDVLPHWSAKGLDTLNGMFYTNLDRNWNTFGSFDQSPAMIARHLFGYTAGYMLSGDEKLIKRAAEIKDYLISSSWDKEYGGWYDMISREGKPTLKTKTTFGQVYIITGLTLYYFATHDQDVLKYITESNMLLEQKVWDPVSGGYFDSMNRDWSVKLNTKSFSSEITPVSGHLLYLFLATRDEQYLKQTEKILEMVMNRMSDPKTGWILESFDTNWNYTVKEQTVNEINTGHNIETAWMLLRAYLLNGRRDYLDAANKLSEQVHQYGFNKESGAWYANFAKESSADHRPLAYWWTQAYGGMFNLNLYRIDKKDSRLDVFRKGSDFWDKYFLDKKDGDTFQGVSLSGEPIDPVKANTYKASYHNMENSLLTSIYLAMWVKKEPLSMHFKISFSKAGDKLYPLPVEEKSYQIEKVLIDGKPFEIQENSGLFLALPELRDAHVEVRIKPEY